MNHQIGIDFDRPLAAVTDPETSHKAAAALRASGAINEQHRRVLEVVQKHPGCTSAELADIYARARGESWKEHRPMFGRRLPELTDHYCYASRRIGPNLVRQGKPRRCSVCGRASVTWWPT